MPKDTRNGSNALNPTHANNVPVLLVAKERLEASKAIIDSQFNSCSSKVIRPMKPPRPKEWPRTQTKSTKSDRNSLDLKLPGDSK